VFDSMRIRTKLAVALIIPLVALLGLASVAISASNQKADDAAARAAKINDQVDLATASLGPSGVIAAIQGERNGEAVDLIGVSDIALTAGQTPENLRAADDVAIAQFETAIASRSAAVQEAYQPAIDAMNTIPGIRSATDAYSGPRTLDGAAQLSSDTFDQYTAIANAVFDGNSKVALSIDDAELRAGATYIDQFSRYQEANTLLLAKIANAATKKGGVTGDLGAFALASEYNGEAESLKGDMARSTVPFYVDLTSSTFANPDLAPADDIIKLGLSGGTIDTASLINGSMTGGTHVYSEALQAAADHLQADATALTTKAQQEQSDAESQARLVLFATGAVLLLAVGVTLLASRSITKPLARLVGDAEDMASTRLPNTVQDILDAPLGDDVVMPELAEVDQSGGFEIAEVATALNTVQASAAELAVEQAVLRRNIADSFVNLGRRNQNLLNRQLESITEMERQESDPEELQKLFTLDHLATRMRRNAESLLLLAGLEPHRQWSAPVAIVDVLRGALGEVEDYERVVIEELDAATISGTAAADLTHMVAELLENALNFSPPGRDVEIIGRAQGEGYVLAIVDNGIGMSDEDMAQANIRLAGAESFTVAPSRYLGHYVVGRQAARLGTFVTLHKTPAGGITAAIELASVLSENETTLADEPAFSPEALIPERIAQSDQATATATTAGADAAIYDVETVDEAPATLAEALGTPLDETEILAEPVGAAAPSTTSSSISSSAVPAGDGDGPTTASGYKKRVRGANTPNTNVLSARGDDTADAEAAEDGASTRSALSGLQAGMQRGRAESANEENEEG